MICGSGGSKSRLAKAAGAEPAGQMRDEKLHAVVARSTLRSKNVQNTRGFGPLLEVRMWKKCTPLWREAHVQVKMYKTPHVRATFGGSDVEKVHAVVARSTCPSQNVQNTTCSRHFWRFGCGKSARRCGAKHMSKSKCTKHHMFAPLLEVRMWKKCTPLWREAHFEVKMLKTLGGIGPLLEVQMSKKSTTLWREAHFEVKMYQNTRGSDHFWKFRCRFASLHYTTLHYTPLHYITLHYTPLHYNYNYTIHPLHSTTLHYTKLHYTTLHYTTLHCLPLHFTTLHYTTLHYNYTTTLHYTPLHYNYNYTTTLH